jgi:hypothetical protein
MKYRDPRTVPMADMRLTDVLTHELEATTRPPPILREGRVGGPEHRAANILADWAKSLSIRAELTIDKDGVRFRLAIRPDTETQRRKLGFGRNRRARRG